MSNGNAKTHCYNSKCQPVESTVHIDTYYMCRLCKQEVTKELYERNKDIANKADSSYDNSHGELDLWSVCNGIDIFGDGQ